MGVRALGKNPTETELKDAFKGVGTRPLFRTTAWLGSCALPLGTGLPPTLPRSGSDSSFR